MHCNIGVQIITGIFLVMFKCSKENIRNKNAFYLPSIFIIPTETELLLNVGIIIFCILIKGIIFPNYALYLLYYYFQHS